MSLSTESFLKSLQPSTAPLQSHRTPFVPRSLRLPLTAAGGGGGRSGGPFTAPQQPSCELPAPAGCLRTPGLSPAPENSKRPFFFFFSFWREPPLACRRTCSGSSPQRQLSSASDRWWRLRPVKPRAVSTGPALVSSAAPVRAWCCLRSAALSPPLES